MAKNKWYIEKAAKHLNDLTYERMMRVGAYMEREIKLTLSQPGHGRKYRRQKGRSGKWHTASTPGQPPAPDTGHLRQTIKHKGNRRTMTVKYGALKTAGRAGEALRYARHLEFGRRGVAPRPFLQVTQRQKADVLRKIMAGKR